PVLEEGQGKREMCWDGCGRPASVCVRAHLPPQPLHTSTTVVVLHHPHALRRNPLATLPLLAPYHTLPGRRLRFGSHPFLDSFYHGHRGDTPSAVFLFPGGRDLGPLAAEVAGPPSVLVVFDGTWRQAKEMVAGSLPFVEQFATRVSLGGCEPGVEGPSTLEEGAIQGLSEHDGARRQGGGGRGHAAVPVEGHGGLPGAPSEADEASLQVEEEGYDNGGRSKEGECKWVSRGWRGTTLHWNPRHVNNLFVRITERDTKENNFGFRGRIC
ncbi:unnamed protein product, partial [Musa banksii]